MEKRKGGGRTQGPNADGPVGRGRSAGRTRTLATPATRPHLAQLLSRFIPNLPVVSQAEIPADVKLHTLANVDIDYAG